MPHRFTPSELELIAQALASYQHNSSFRVVRKKVQALVEQEITKQQKTVVIPIIGMP